MTRVLLVGGAGFIGRRVALRLLELGVTPVVLDIPASLAKAPPPPPRAAARTRDDPLLRPGGLRPGGRRGAAARRRRDPADRGDAREMAEFVAELARRTGWTGVRVEGPPLRMPADLASDPVPAALGDHPATSIEAGIAAPLAELAPLAR